MSTPSEESKTSLNPKPAPNAQPDSILSEPPRILDRMLADIEASVAEKLSTAGVSTSAATGAKKEKPAPSPPPKTVKVPSHPFEPAPETVFAPPVEKPPKASFKGNPAKPAEPPNKTAAASPPPNQPPPRSDTLGSAAQAPKSQPNSTSIAERPAPRSPWLTFGTVALVLLNLTLVIALLLFLFDALPDRDLIRARTAAEEQPRRAPVVDDSRESPFVEPEQEEPEIPELSPIAEIQEKPILRNLEITKLAFARSVTGFALYDPVPDIALRPHHVEHMFIYTEFSHPRPEDREDGRYVYNLTKNVRMFRADVGPTEPLMNTTISLVERGWSPRQDFHARQRLQSARPIREGEHIVEVRITDRNSSEVATEQTSFMIHAN